MNVCSSSVARGIWFRARRTLQLSPALQVVVPRTLTPVDREYETMRKRMIAIAAAMALGTATMATAAMAASRGGTAGGGGGHMGGFSGGGAATAHVGGGFGGGPGNVAGTRGNFVAPQGNFAGTRSNFAGTASGNVAGTRRNFAANGWAHDRDHDRHHRFHGFGFGGLYAFGGPDYYGYDDNYSDSCWQQRLVPTPFGLRWRPVDVCEY
jgi:hypothetical protein